ncbi:MAG TPA: hypothetical protein VKX17_12820 [Planctomycetota bacterium]|nr:hypothetical protein [Planctomycetota bacterium]
MSLEIIKPADLLGAYLSNELSPEERRAVERYLNEDPAATELLDEMRELTLLLKEGEREVSQATIDALRRTVLQKIREKQLKALVTVSITGDLTEQERADVKYYMSAHPAAEAAQKQALSTAVLLKEGNVSANDALAGKLREKLKSVLPAAAMARSQKTEPLIRSASSESARTSRPSLRVFVRPENPWRKRFITVAASIAALLAIGVFVRAWWINRSANPVATSGGENIIPNEGKVDADHDRKEIVPVPNPNYVENGTDQVAPPKNPGDRNVPPPKKRDETIATQQQNPVVPPKDNSNQPDQKIAVDVAPKTNAVPDEKQPVPPNSKTANNDPKKSVTPDNTVPTPPNVAPNNNVPVPPTEVVGPAKNSSGGVPFVPNIPNPIAPNNPNPLVPPVPSIDVAGGSGTVVPPKVPNTPQNGLGTTSANTPPPANGIATVGSIKNGDVQVSAPGGATSVSAKSGDTLASGSKIVTSGTSLIALNIGGGGLLYVKSNSSVVVNFGAQTAVTLIAGEIYYNPVGAPKASLTVSAGQVQAPKLGEADVTLSGGRLVVLNESNAALKLGKLSAAPGDESSIAADGSDAWRKDTAPAITDNGLWRQPVMLDLDSLKARKSRSR